ncbi:MAG TPA: rhodanese-like domain-containing protein [Verrucomicrobiae bacterium]|nr:rhodanese-like domain-containing protein [Verrucomicrobiae bacterium]
MRDSACKSALIEAIFIAICGCILAFAANALSPRGLRLSRNYFPAAPTIAGQNEHASTNTPSAELARNAYARLKERLAAEGLQLIDGETALDLFHQSRQAPNAIIFIDARDDAHYATAHVPGAYQLDRYRPEAYLPTVIPACLAANKIVVYCNGGECEDSEFAARMLKDDIKIPAEKLFVYGGGITEWTERKWPLEAGARNSGTAAHENN